MVPGINTDVTHDGFDYHVQTEDLGAKNPIILTLVYRNGAVVLRETLDYGQTLATEPSPSLIRALMDAQHRRVTRHVSDGELEARALGPEEPTAASPSKTVDALIEEYLCTRRRARGASAAHRES
jgi:hypothetical protein